MLEISENDILNRMRRDNPWWETGEEKILEKDFPKRDYFPAFYHLVSQRDIRRAVVLMGPRQVGKTVMAKQAVLALLREKKTPNHIFFASLDTPIMIGQHLEKVLRLYLENFGDEEAGGWVFFDEVQYLKDWEVHLKSLVDSYPQMKFVVTGSAAAVLKRKSQESGAGRFSDFILPPLTFAEFLRFKNFKYERVDSSYRRTKEGYANASDVFLKAITREIHNGLLNDCFVEYLTYGGYPEIVRSEALQTNFDQYLRSDIIDKVLLRDLPTLYGVTDVQEMNRLFATLVYNTGQEVSLEKLSNASGVSKPTIKKYIDYFEAAFLIRKLSRVTETAKGFKREVAFKIYVSNPSLYSALFGPPDPDDYAKMGHLAETAVVSQSFNMNTDSEYRYARWKTGEVDLVAIGKSNQKPLFAMEVKWSDRIKNDIRVAKNIIEFFAKNPSIQSHPIITTRTFDGQVYFRGREVDCVPTAFICLQFANSAVNSLNEKVGLDEQPELDL